MITCIKLVEVEAIFSITLTLSLVRSVHSLIWLSDSWLVCCTQSSQCNNEMSFVVVADLLWMLDWFGNWSQVSHSEHLDRLFSLSLTYYFFNATSDWVSSLMILSDWTFFESHIVGLRLSLSHCTWVWRMLDRLPHVDTAVILQATSMAIKWVCKQSCVQPWRYEQKKVPCLGGYWVHNLKSGPGTGRVYPMRIGKTAQYLQFCLREYAVWKPYDWSGNNFRTCSPGRLCAHR